ncbi:MAG TPA: NOP5/NOP56 family protein [Candidatus Thermoplasmatota archaeon]|nr:NOP5/NOP56 family protein [Candidatus Thermoplasmatota archaeon]
MPRPVWFEKGLVVAAVADHLEAAAKAAQAPLRFEAVQVPGGTDLGVLHQAALTVARRKLSLSNTETDRILAQEVRAIDDLVRTANLLVERLREWYALHAPEATRLVTDAQELAELVATHGQRDAVLKALDQANMAQTSLGTDLQPEDMAVLQGFAGALSAVHQSWHALEARVAVLMEQVAPNVSSVVGPVLGARLIALSGGLSRLATWPSGTVQLLGAETALFRHLKEGTRSPKHGILFQHPTVHQAPPWQRGPTARALALAAATGAKADAFTKNDIRPFLAAQLKADMERIVQRKPPARNPFNPRFAKPGGARGPARSGGPSYGRDRDGPRSPPRSFPPRDAPRGPPRDDRGPPRSGGYGGPARDAPRGPPRDDRGPPRSGGYGAGARDDRGPPRTGGYGAGARDDRGPPRDGPRPPFRRDGPGGPGSGGTAGAAKPWKRKPQGAFRSDNKPARPPGSGDRKPGAGGGSS